MLGNKTVCLNMIVKNEAAVIGRCLESVIPIIDHWVIVDTGSTDGTPDLIKETLRSIPGRIHYRPWYDFGRNRTEAICLAQNYGDYVLLLDADHVLERCDGADAFVPTHDAYMCEIWDAGIVYQLKRLVKGSLPWYFVGELHEVMDCSQPYTESATPCLRIHHLHDGARGRDPETYRREIATFEAKLAANPDDTRTTFYLAQFHRDLGDYGRAIDLYRKRATMGGWREEVFQALYEVGKLKEQTGEPWEETLRDYLAAYECNPDRIEPLYRIGMYYQKRREYQTAALFLERAAKAVYPAGNRLFIERAIYSYLAGIEYAVACHWSGRYAEAVRMNDDLLRRSDLPPAMRTLIQKNQHYSVSVLETVTPRPGSTHSPDELEFLGMPDNPLDRRRVNDLASRCHHGVAVEIGSYAGRMSLVIADHFKQTICVDVWEQDAVFEAFCKNIDQRFMRTIFPCRGRSLDIARRWNLPIDFLYIDADHSYESVKADIEAWTPHVVPGGVIAGHDYWENRIWPGVNRAVDEAYPDRELVPGSSVWSVVKS